MSRKHFFISAAVMLTGTTALAQVDPQTLADRYRAEGYTYVEITVGPNHIEVEAIRGGTEIEVVYDRATGEILETEQSPARIRDMLRRGIEIETTNEDLLDDDDDDDDGQRGRGRGRGGDDDDGDGDDDGGRGDDDDDGDDDGGRGDDDGDGDGDDDGGRGDDDGDGDDDGGRGDDDGDGDDD